MLNKNNGFILFEIIKHIFFRFSMTSTTCIKTEIIHIFSQISQIFVEVSRNIFIARLFDIRGKSKMRRVYLQYNCMAIFIFILGSGELFSK